MFYIARCLVFNQLNGGAAAGGQLQGEGALGGDLVLFDADGVGLALVVGIGGVAVNAGCVGGVGVQEIEGELKGAGFFVCDAAQVPVVAFAVFAYGSEVGAYLGMGYQGTFPVNGAGFYKIEGGRVGLVVFNHIGGHLQGTVQHYSQGQLLGQGGVDAGAGHGWVLEVENAGGKVHRSCQSPCKGNDGGVVGRVATVGGPGVPFLTAYAFLGHEVGPGTLQAGGHGGFVVVDHDVVLGGFFYYAAVMTNGILTGMVFFAVEKGAYIAGFYGFYAVFLIKGKSVIDLCFIVEHIASCFVMPDKAYAFLGGVTGDFFKVEVGVSFGEAEA